MKSGWVSKELGEVCEVTMGASPDSKSYNSNQNGLPFYQGKTEFGKEHPTPVKWCDEPVKVAFAGDVLLSVRAPIGPVNFANEKCCIGRGLAALRFSGEQRFLYYLLQANEVELDSRGTGTTFKCISGQALRSLPITFPPLAEQKRIVAKIDAAFDKIDALKANAEKNLANAKELFQSALDEAMRPKKGWVEKRLGEVCAITSVMVDPTLSQFTNMLHVGGGNIVSETGELIDLKSAKEEKLKSGKYTFNKSMVLYNKIRPYLKKVARPHFSGLCSADMYPLLPNDSITRDFLYYILLTNQFTTYAIGESERAGMPKVNREELFAYRVKIPGTQDEQNAIAEKMDGVRKSLQTLQQNYARQIADCAEMRQAILREAFEGRL